ncbi:MAG TPA: hypothetical protein VJN18_23210 [Polyangiaceae bacterium]|nr:hypothetical protein [Polyangiaceae bacterium]
MFPVLRRFVAVLIALVFFAPGSAFGRVLYACSMSGEVSAGPCCCHKAKAHKTRTEKDQPAPTRLERPDCCEAKEQQRATTAASHGAAEVQVLAAAPSTLLPAIEPAAAASDVMRPLPHTARGPPDSLIYLTNCSLLI